MERNRLESAYWALRLVFGIVPIVAGLDKFTNLLTHWQGYLSPLARSCSRISRPSMSAPERGRPRDRRRHGRTPEAGLEVAVDSA